jgi:hypothetical protein
MEKKALFVLDDELLVDIFRVVFERTGYLVKSVDNPRDAIDEIAKSAYTAVLIGNNKGSVVKSKLADIIYSKAFNSKPHVILIREPGDIIYKSDNITFIRKPSFYQDLTKTLSMIEDNQRINNTLNENKDSKITEGFVKNKNFKVYSVSQFFKNLKGNKKFEILCGGKKIVGFLMNNEIYILFSELKEPYAVLSCEHIEVAMENIEIAEFLSLKLGDDVFRFSYREFILNGIDRISDKDRLLLFFASLNRTFSIKAPQYVLKQCRIANENANINWLESHSGTITIKEILEKYDYDILKIKTLVVMYILNMIELSEEDLAKETEKFDVKIKKGFLHKIMDKIRGL